MIFTAIVCVIFVDKVLDVFLSPLIRLYLAPLFSPFVFAAIPAIFLYFREISGRPVPQPARHFAIVLLIAICTSVIVWTIHGNTDANRLLLTDQGLGLNWKAPVPVTALMLAMIAVYCGQFIAYMIAIWRTCLVYHRQVQQQFGLDGAVLPNWTIELLVETSVIFAIYTAINLFDIFVLRSEWLIIVAHCGFALVFFRISHVIAANPALFVEAGLSGKGDVPGKDNRPVVDVGSDNGATSRHLVEMDEAQRICRRLNQIIAREEVIFDPLLSMPKLAQLVGVTPNQLSYVLNRYIEKSFFDFVNSERVVHAKRLLVTEPDRQVLDIAINIGFNSKSTFNLAFKKITGTTPSVYRAERTAKDIPQIV
ncbi:AraC family transcriptional regulator [Thalassospira sp. TSL5-1]|uniref:helix-turn-helix domain-containing protein n=1 Tax=Thalassospira sp. TSL5-1 TaxID=1544451 RepID=UPI00208FF474|nr:helix-turn-helix domain-containing protein [Thalassospira sp. TSL5-1]